MRPVEEAWAQQKQFVADASHELKTPLTVLLANAELMCAEGSTPCEQQALARGTLAAARRMRSLVEKLLELARADGRRAGAPRAPAGLGPGNERGAFAL